jgi:hypothetical protein
VSTDRGAVTELEAALTSRHRAVSDVGRWLVVNPALPERLAGVSVLFERLALDLLAAIETDSPELTRALSQLVRAKDSAVRAAILDDEVADASA